VPSATVVGLNLSLFLPSKLLSALTQPIFWLALWWALALALLIRWRRLAMAMLWGGLFALGLLGFRAIPDALLRPLEASYKVPSATVVESAAGLIVLGGGIAHPDSFLAHRQVPLGEAAERMTVSAALTRQYPNLALVFSGGEGRLRSTGVSESALAQVFYQEQGVGLSADKARVQFEGRSRTTRENAQQVAVLLGDRCQKPWLLMTSAWHMPRAMAEFEAEFGPNRCTVIPYPVDFRTGESTAFTEYSLAQSLLRWEIALHEWLGLLVYRATRAG
jgi:uncharacterized SAM-binding protein YcdF (DUF218 family)